LSRPAVEAGERLIRPAIPGKGRSFIKADLRRAVRFDGLRIVERTLPAK
jgi:hypothetical protein